MRLVSDEYRRRFFSGALATRTCGRRPRPSRELIAFRLHNLMQPLAERPFDLVFLKNVLIYFDAASKQTVVDHVRAMIRPGGLLVAGAAEGIGELFDDFTRLEPWLYRRTEA